MRKKSFNCPGELTVSLIGGKWKVILLYNLRRSTLRFGELKRRSPGITPATLTIQLRELEEADLICRKRLGTDRSDGVEYSLTKRGESLRPVINALIKWGLVNQSEYVIGEFGMAKFNS